MLPTAAEVLSVMGVVTRKDEDTLLCRLSDAVQNHLPYFYIRHHELEGDIQGVKAFLLRKGYSADYYGFGKDMLLVSWG